MNREVKSLLTAVAAGEVGPQLAARAKRLLSPVKRPATPRHPACEAAKERKTAKREARTKKLAALRETITVKWGGRCGACYLPLASALRLHGSWHLHHVLGGGLRRHHESEATCVPLCADCHHRIHGGETAALETLREQAATLHLGLIVAALDKRLAKVAEARAAQRTPSTETRGP